MLLYQSCFTKISIIFPPSNLTFRMTVLIEEFRFFSLLLHFFALYMQLQHWWCVPADVWKYLTCSSPLLFLIFVPFPKSQPDWRGCGPQLHVCRVAVRVTACFQFERLLIFMSNVRNSPDARHARSQGRHAPSFQAARADRGLHAGMSSTLLASPDTKSRQRRQLLTGGSSSSTLSAVF